MNTIFLSLVVLGTIGLLAAIILYVVSQKFKVEENPIIDEVEAALPSANCGGCGFPEKNSYVNHFLKGQNYCLFYILYVFFS